MKNSTYSKKYLLKYIKENKDNEEKVKEAELHLKALEKRKRKNL